MYPYLPGDMDQADMLFRSMIASGYQPDISSYHHLMQGMKRIGRMDRCRELALTLEALTLATRGKDTGVARLMSTVLKTKTLNPFSR